MKIEKLKDVLPVVAIDDSYRYTALYYNSPIQVLVDMDTSIVLADANVPGEGDFALMNEYEGITKTLDLSDEDLWNLPVKKILFRRDCSYRRAWLDVYVDLPS